jgi:hypothetical protein
MIIDVKFNVYQVEHYWNVHLQKDDQHYVTDVQHWFTAYA